VLPIEATASRNVIRWTLLAAILVLLEGCGTLYVTQAARGQWQVMRARRPIAQVLADPATSAQLRASLETVREARDFASRELGLPDNDTFRSYADVRRQYVVWNVVVAPEFSVTPRRWCFPIAGCVNYRGYFTEKAARSFAGRLEREGLDVAVGGVAAYSTLGRFADPVLNTMVAFGAHELAAIIFHELAHQVVYVAGDSAFNEAFAVTVEQAGLERWLAQRGEPGALERFQARRTRQLEYLRAFARTRAKLAALYARDLPTRDMRERKRAIFDGLAAEMRALERAQNAPSPYGAWFEKGLNNAHLATVATYFDCVPGFQRLLAGSGGDLGEFYAAVRELAGLPRAERQARVCSGVSGAGAQPARSESGQRGRADAETRTSVLATDAVDGQ
jgi:predicted aminopeptidase